MMNIRMKKRNDRRSGRGWSFSAQVDLRRLRRVCAFIASCWLLVNPAMALSLDEETVEYPLKLACLYNFTKFIEWPAGSYRDPEASLAICIVGVDPFNPKL
jgi:hypothetical protein